MKKIILAFLACFVLTGCSTKQVHDKYYLKTVYISQKKDVLYSKMIFYNESANEVSAKGITFDEIIEKSELSCGKSIFTGHTELIILNNCDVGDTLEHFLEVWKVSPSCKVVLGSDKLNISSITSDVIDVAIEQKKAPKCDIVTILSDINTDEAHTVYFNSDSSFQQAIIKD